MADIPNWIRGTFRTKSPNPAATLTSDQFMSSGFEESSISTKVPDQTRLATSSYHSPFYPFSLHRGEKDKTSPPKLAPPSLLTSQEQKSKFPLYRGVDETCKVFSSIHNPTPEQMADTVKTFMMTHGNFEQLPVKYNSCLLHVLERFEQMAAVVREAEISMEQMEKKHEKTVQDLESVIVELQRREQGYKEDVRMLEVMLASGESGLGIVSMVRTKSKLQQKSTVKEKDSTWTSRPGSIPTTGKCATKVRPFTVNFAERRDARVSSALKSKREPADFQQNQYGGPRRSQHYKSMLGVTTASPLKTENSADGLNLPVFQTHTIRQSGFESEEQSETSSESLEAGTDAKMFRDRYLATTEGSICGLGIDGAVTDRTSYTMLPTIPLGFDRKNTIYHSQSDDSVEIISNENKHLERAVQSNDSVRNSIAFSFSNGDDAITLSPNAKRNYRRATSLSVPVIRISPYIPIPPDVPTGSPHLPSTAKRDTFHIKTFNDASIDSFQLEMKPTLPPRTSYHAMNEFSQLEVKPILPQEPNIYAGTDITQLVAYAIEKGQKTDSASSRKGLPARDDSKSSIVTVVKSGSVAGSAGGQSRNSGDKERHQVNQAAIAAVRAIARKQ